MNNYYKLQNILFCDNERLEDQWEMFYRSSRPVYDFEDKKIVIGPAQVVNFCTYFNSIAWTKWQTYTWTEKLFLKLKVKGDMEIILTGYEKKDTQYVRRIVGRKKVSFAAPEEVILEYPENNLMVSGFEIHTFGMCEVYEGEYGTDIEEDKIRHVSLHLATTTFKKEEYITSNIKLLKETVLAGNDSLAEHLWVHVVDNGRTLPVEEIETEHVSVHRNLNTGGAGGFTRGMLESLDHKEKPTHVLLMDDDVMILPESLRRTYNLLSLVRPEYEDHFISGAMLAFEEMFCFYEDIGYVNEEGAYGPLKGKEDLRRIDAVLRNDEMIPQPKNAYAGWWFCCIPVKFVRKDNLPIPVFVRGDDVEYSLRNKARFITLSGICIWHMGFTNKFNGAMEFYQVHRNSLMLQAVSGVCQNVDFMDRIRKLIRVNLLRFNYDGAEQLMDSIEDYMKGYRFFMKNQGEKLIKEEAQKNEKMLPLSQFPEAPENVWSIYENPPRSIIETNIYRLTYNGHFWPSKLLKKETGVIAYDWFYSPKRYFLRKRLLAVNPHMRTAAYREMDKARFMELLKREKRLFNRYERIHTRLEKEYREHRKELTSESFWRKYLELDK